MPTGHTARITKLEFGLRSAIRSTSVSHAVRAIFEGRSPYDHSVQIMLTQLLGNTATASRVATKAAAHMVNQTIAAIANGDDVPRYHLLLQQAEEHDRLHGTQHLFTIRVLASTAA